MIERTAGITRRLIDRIINRRPPAPHLVDRDRGVPPQIEAIPYHVLLQRFYQEVEAPLADNPEEFARILIEGVDETFQIVGNREIRRSRDDWFKWVSESDEPWSSRAGDKMSEEELRTKARAKEKRELMLRLMKQALDRSPNRGPLVAKLNEWFSGDLDLEETGSVLNALQDYANLDTIHLIVEKQSGGSSLGANRNSALILISRHYEEFKGDSALEGYLDRITRGLPKVVSAIRDGKRIKEVGVPYGTDLAIDETPPILATQE